MADWRPVSAAVTRSRCTVVFSCAATSASVASASSVLVVTRTDGGHLVVLGLADQVGGDVAGIGGVVGEDGDLRRAGLGVDADLRAADPLGGGDVDVARAGDHVDRRQLGAVGVGAAVGEQRDGLRAADRPYLVDAEHAGGGQDRRVRQPAERRPAAGWRSPASPRPAICAGTTFITTLDG